MTHTVVQGTLNLSPSAKKKPSQHFADSPLYNEDVSLNYILISTIHPIFFTSPPLFSSSFDIFSLISPAQDQDRNKRTRTNEPDEGAKEYGL